MILKLRHIWMSMCFLVKKAIPKIICWTYWVLTQRRSKATTAWGETPTEGFPQENQSGGGSSTIKPRPAVTDNTRPSLARECQSGRKKIKLDTVSSQNRLVPPWKSLSVSPNKEGILFKIIKPRSACRIFWKNSVWRMVVHTFSVFKNGVARIFCFKNGGARKGGLREKGTNLAWRQRWWWSWSISGPRWFPH